MKDIPWFPLDPSKADHGAVNGARVAGCTLLELPSGTCVVVGLMSCANRTDAERCARANPGRADKDRTVTEARLLSWSAR